MSIRIGLDDTDTQVSIDTTTRTRIALLGPPGCGKTTTCRYLGRRWLASTGGHCLLVTPRPYEYGNLDVAQIQDPGRVSVPDQASMLIVDEADLITPELVVRAMRSAHGLVIVASFGPALTDLTTSDVDGTPDFDAIYALEHTPRLDAAPVQSRLDWPANTIPVFLDQRRHLEFPVHKWAM
jgi:energy-coupling factor transporter ATP-binding protein EcfA2